MLIISSYRVSDIRYIILSWSMFCCCCFCFFDNFYAYMINNHFHKSLLLRLKNTELKEKVQNTSNLIKPFPQTELNIMEEGKCGVNEVLSLPRDSNTAHIHSKFVSLISSHPGRKTDQPYKKIWAKKIMNFFLNLYFPQWRNIL